MEKLKRKVYFFVILVCFAAMLSSCSNASGGEGGGGDKPSKPGEITYTVEHWQQNILDDDYTKVEADTQTLTGTANKKTAAQAKTYTGFTAKAPEQVTLTEGKNTVIKIYYDRNIITYIFSANGGKWANDKTELKYEKKFGSAFKSPENPVYSTANEDYKFTGWDKEIPQTVGSENLKFTAQWDIDKILCKISYYLQNLDDNGYTKVEEDTQYVKLPQMWTDADVPNDYKKDYAGFEFRGGLLNQGPSVDYYYDRKVTAITFNANGGKFYSGSLDPITINRKYGATFSIGMGEELWPSRDNYEFRGWAYNSNATSCDFGPNLYFEVKDTPLSAVTLYAIWRVDSNFNIGLFFVSGGDVEIVPEGGSYHAKPEIDGTYTYEWYLNNNKLSSNTEYCTIDVSSLAEGVYALVVKATSSTGIVYVSQYSLPVYGEAQ